VGPDGRTLYVFTRDAPNMTNCSGNCLQIWPPLLLEEGQEVDAEDGIDGTFDMIDTPSGTQVTYNQAPLYYFASDTAAGQTNGHLVGNVWFVARPDTASTAVVNVSGANADAYLVGPTGLSLYLFANDTEGVSNCSGQCLENWPALTVPEGLDPTAVDAAGGELGTITRDDGGIQVTYNGLPLYYYVGDSVPGDTTGDGVGGVWELAAP
jgi:predicted lipoprotein with Yx(FWY)xxD motif